jgi:hypothetical protein
MPSVEISDRDSDRLLPSLGHILNILEECGSRLDWYLVEFYPVFLLGADGSVALPPPEWVSNVWYKVDKSGETVKLTWSELKDLAKYVGQMDSCLIIVPKPGVGEPLEPIDLNSENWEIVIQSIDASFWTITSHNEKVLDKVRSAFHKTKTVATTDRGYY